MSLPIQFPRNATGVYKYAVAEESLCNRLLIGHLKSVAYQTVSITLPKGVVVELYIGFQLGTFYSQEYSPGTKTLDPKVEVRCLVAYHYSPVGGHNG